MKIRDISVSRCISKMTQGKVEIDNKCQQALRLFFSRSLFGLKWPLKIISATATLLIENILINAA